MPKPCDVWRPPSLRWSTFDWRATHCLTSKVRSCYTPVHRWPMRACARRCEAQQRRAVYTKAGLQTSVPQGRCSAPAGANLGACHSRQAVGTMTGIITPAMPVFVVENEEEPHNVAFGRVTEGFGKGLRFGNQTPENLARLRWVRDVLAPSLRAAMQHLPRARIP